jgi:hypothetical protein
MKWLVVVTVVVVSAGVVACGPPPCQGPGCAAVAGGGAAGGGLSVSGGGTTAAGGGSGGGAAGGAAMACTTVANCPQTNDCKCNNGERRAGASCENGVCLDRDAVCTRLCSTRMGWIPNPAGCASWQLIDASTDLNGDPGTGANYAAPLNAGCSSGARILVSITNPVADYGWCIPTVTCASGSGKCIGECAADSDCPLDSDGTSRWVCNGAVKSERGTPMRLCRPPKLGNAPAPYCAMR